MPRAGGRSSAGRAPERHSGGARSIRVVRSPEARGVREARRAPTSSVQVRLLVGLSSRAGAGSGYLRKGGLRGRAVRLRVPAAPHDRDEVLAAGRNGFRFSTPNRQVAGSSPARSTRAPVAQQVEHVRAVSTRPQQVHCWREGAALPAPPGWSRRRRSRIGRDGDRGALRLRAEGGRLPVRAPGCVPGGRRVRVAPGASLRSSVAPFFATTTAPRREGRRCPISSST
jgi:hypothetical protein